MSNPPTTMVGIATTVNPASTIAGMMVETIITDKIQITGTITIPEIEIVDSTAATATLGITSKVGMTIQEQIGVRTTRAHFILW